MSKEFWHAVVQALADVIETIIEEATKSQKTSKSE